MTRRDVVAGAAAAGAALALSPSAAGAAGAAAPWFRVSLAEWSLHRTLWKPAAEGGISNLEFPGFAKSRCGVDAIEYVNAFFKSPGPDGQPVARGHDFGYLEDLRGAVQDAGVESLLIMVDGEGLLGDDDEGRRRDAVENHFKWIAAAAYLGCHSIRVNAGGEGEASAVAARCADSLRRIARVGDGYDVNVIVENHGGLSSDGAWLAGVMRAADHPRVGTLPDFGNFYEYDRYQGVEDLMPFAKAVSAKTYDFDASGNETKIDYARMLDIVKTAGYRGWIGIEYEGQDGDEVKGIVATRKLLERLNG